MTVENEATKSATPPLAVIAAVRKILRPLVRLLLSFRITFPQLAELLKETYVDVAEQEFRLPDKPQTDTRLSLLTGIHRKDIKRLRAMDEQEKVQAIPLMIDVGGKLVARWLGESFYQDEQGKPRALPLKAEADQPSFERLVQDVCKQDIRPRVIMDEWLNLGIISVDAAKQVHLDAQALIPRKGLEEKAFFFGHNVADHLHAASHNMLDKQPAFFERCVYYDGLSEESVQVLRAAAAKQGMETLLALNELALSLKEQDTASVQTHCSRINVGLYVYHEDEGKGHE